MRYHLHNAVAVAVFSEGRLGPFTASFGVACVDIGAIFLQNLGRLNQLANQNFKKSYYVHAF